MYQVLNKKEPEAGSRGAVIAELALVLPLLTLLLLGILDLGLIIREHQVVQNAAREGARFSVLPSYNKNTSPNPAAVDAQIRSRVTAYAQLEGITINPADITINQSATITIVTGGVTFMESASEITVTYSRPFLIPAASIIPFTSVTLTGRAIFRNLY